MKDTDRSDGERLCLKREDTYHKTEACWVEEERDAHDTALKAKIEVKLDPEAGLDVA